MRGSVLIIDDERDLCDVVRESLEIEGFVTSTAHSGEQAILAVNQSAFDALLVDLRLEGFVSGLDVIKHFKGRLDRPKILAVSGTPKPAMQELFEREGIRELVDKILEKPADVRPDTIVRHLKAILA